MVRSIALLVLNHPLTWTWNRASAVCLGNWTVCFRCSASFHPLKQVISLKAEIKKLFWHFFLEILQDLVCWWFKKKKPKNQHKKKNQTKPMFQLPLLRVSLGCILLSLWSEALAQLPRLQYCRFTSPLLDREAAEVELHHCQGWVWFSYLDLYYDFITVLSCWDFVLLITVCIKNHYMLVVNKKMIWNEVFCSRVNVLYIRIKVLPFFQAVPNNHWRIQAPLAGIQECRQTLPLLKGNART